jgi:beta-lactamase regulating signal transducer with metallopeptidase domain
VHTLLGLTSVLLVLLGSSLVLVVLRRLGGWTRRRDLQFLVLAAPIVSLGLGLLGLHHFAGRACFLGAPPWDYTLGVAVPVVMALVALGGLGLGLVRLVLLYRLVNRAGVTAGGELEALVDRLAAQLGTARPRLRLCVYHRPLALTCGLVRPTLLLSTWMVDRLDRRELEGVLAHEVAHAARRDYLVVWLATVLRDAFCYLPTSWAAYRQLQDEKEAACDDLAVGVTRRPLALASALAKVWQQAVDGPTFEGAQALMGPSGRIEGRIERLLTSASGPSSGQRSRIVALGIGASALAVLLALEAVNVTVLFAPMGCGPASLLGRLF